MPYSINPNLPKARGEALKALLLEQIPVGICARKYGVHRSTLYRWKKKWQALYHAQIININQPNRKLGRVFRFHDLRFLIPTTSSAPKSHPRRIAEWLTPNVSHDCYPAMP